MSTGVTIVDRIITAITIQVQAVYGFGVEVCGIIGRDKSAPLGAVIPGVAIIQAGVVIVVIATTTNRVGLTYILPNFPPVVKKKPPRPSWSGRLC